MIKILLLTLITPLFIMGDICDVHRELNLRLRLEMCNAEYYDHYNYLVTIGRCQGLFEAIELIERDMYAK